MTGSRDWRQVTVITDALRSLPPIGTTIVHGCATGADAIARSIAVRFGFSPEDHWPDYAKYPTADAPKRRNQEMVDAGADLCLAFPMPGSRGTWDCVDRANAASIAVVIYHPNGHREEYAAKRDLKAGSVPKP